MVDLVIRGLSPSNQPHTNLAKHESGPLLLGALAFHLLFVESLEHLMVCVCMFVCLFVAPARPSACLPACLPAFVPVLID